MPKIIFKCGYIKNAVEHRENLVVYVAIREGVEKIPQVNRLLPSTQKQKQLITDILSQFPDTESLFEYEDYLAHPTVENASEFISAALDQNLDKLSHQKVYVNYIATHPRAEKLGSHGLFSDEETPLVLSRVAEEVAQHAGNVWTPIISLRREDAARLGYDNAAAWKDLLRKQRNVFAEQVKITPENLRWYAAFHNEGHHPHCHMIVYSVNSREGYVTKPAIEKLRSSLARDIFQQDLLQIYSEQTVQRSALTEQSREVLRNILAQMQSGACDSPVMEDLLSRLAERLKHTSGKKQYGYLRSPLKSIVDQIVDELAKDEGVAKAYAQWYEIRDEVLRTYRDELPEPLPLSCQKEFKSIKNMVIVEAMNIGSHHIIFEGDEPITEAVFEPAFDDAGSGSEMTEEEQSHDEKLQYRLEQMLYTGTGTEVDVAAAVVYFEKAARLDNVHAQYMLGKVYLDANSGHQNVEKAIQWLTKVADGGNSLAQYALGKIYHDGGRVEKDVEKAIALFTLSAELFVKVAKQNNSFAQYALGKLYLMGREVSRDREAAIRWLTLSAEQRNIYAQFFLDHLDFFRDPSLFLASTRLLHHLCRIFQEEQRKHSARPAMQTDSKLRQKIRQKKIAQGHASDDHEQKLITY